MVLKLPWNHIGITVSWWALWISWVAFLDESTCSPVTESKGWKGQVVWGLWTLTIWPLGGWFPYWLPLFLTNNWDLIWVEISKAPWHHSCNGTVFCSFFFILRIALKETSLSGCFFVGRLKTVSFGAEFLCWSFLSKWQNRGYACPLKWSIMLLKLWSSFPIKSHMLLVSVSIFENMAVLLFSIKTLNL